MRRGALPHLAVPWYLNRTELVGWIMSSEGLRSANYNPVVPYRVHYRSGMAEAFFVRLMIADASRCLRWRKPLGT